MICVSGLGFKACGPEEEKHSCRSATPNGLIKHLCSESRKTLKARDTEIQRTQQIFRNAFRGTLAPKCFWL